MRILDFIRRTFDWALQSIPQNNYGTLAETFFKHDLTRLHCIASSIISDSLITSQFTQLLLFDCESYAIASRIWNDKVFVFYLLTQSALSHSQFLSLSMWIEVTWSSRAYSKNIKMRENSIKLEQNRIDEESKPLNSAELEVKTIQKDQWGNEIEFLLSCITLSVGLGNVWRYLRLWNSRCYQLALSI